MCSHSRKPRGGDHGPENPPSSHFASGGVKGTLRRPARSHQFKTWPQVPAHETPQGVWEEAAAVPALHPPFGNGAGREMRSFLAAESFKSEPTAACSLPTEAPCLSEREWLRGQAFLHCHGRATKLFNETGRWVFLSLTCVHACVCASRVCARLCARMCTGRWAERLSLRVSCHTQSPAFSPN